MYSFYCDHLKAKYADRGTLLFTDTESLCCEIHTYDLYADMMDSLDLYDTINFNQTHSIKTRTASLSKNLKVRPVRCLLTNSSACVQKIYSLRAPTKSYKKTKGIQKTCDARTFPGRFTQNKPQHDCKVLHDQVDE